MITPEKLRLERSRIEGFLRHAETHLERGNLDAVREALEDARARLESLRSLVREDGEAA